MNALIYVDYELREQATFFINEYIQLCTFGCNSLVHDLGLGVAKSCEIAMSGHMAYTVT